MKNILSALLGSAVIVLGIITINQQKQITLLKTVEDRAAAPGPSKSPAAVTPDSAPEDAAVMEKLREENQKLRDRLETANQLLAGFSAANDEQARELEDAAAVVEEKAAEPPMKAMMSGLSEMMKGEEMQNMIRMQAEAAMDTSYGPLWAYLELDETTRNELKALLLDKQMKQMEAGFEIMNGGMDKDAMKERGGKMAAMSREYDDKIKALLGEESYDLFQQFEQTQLERMQVQQFKTLLTTADSLTEEQERVLVEKLFAERKSFQTLNLAYGDQADSMEIFSKENMEKFEEEGKALLEKQVAIARDLLSETQFQKFEAQARQQFAMQLMGMRMASEMMGMGARQADEPQL